MKHIITLIFAFTTLGLYAQDIPDKYLLQAAQNNPGVKAKFNEYMAAMEKIPQVKALPDPQLAFGIFIMPVETKIGPQQAKIGITQTFPWFGTLNIKSDLATCRAKSKYEVFEESKSKLFNEVRSVYYNMYFTKRAIQTTNEHLEILESLEKLSLIKMEAAKSSAVNQLRIKMEKNELINKKAMLQDLVHQQKTEFNSLINTEVLSEISIIDSLNESPLDIPYTVLLDSIKTQNHRIGQIQNQVDAYNKQQILAKKNSMPNINLGLDYILIGNDGNTMPNAGQDALTARIGFSIPIYRKKYKALLNEAALMHKASENKTIDIENSLEILFSKTYKNYLDAQRRIALYKEQTELAKNTLSLLHQEYAVDGKKFEEVLRMERRLLNYVLEQEKARTDLNTAKAFIAYLMGN